MQGLSAVQLCGSGMLASDILNLFRSASSPGNLLQQTATNGDRLCRVPTCQEGSRTKKRTVDGEERASERKAVD